MLLTDLIDSKFQAPMILACASMWACTDATCCILHGQVAGAGSAVLDLLFAFEIAQQSELSGFASPQLMGAVSCPTCFILTYGNSTRIPT